VSAFLVSTGIVAIAEIGDKTQLLSLILAARLRRPMPIISGILVATLLNHALAGAVGTWLLAALGPHTTRWVLGLSFIAMAAWALVPDRLDDMATPVSRWGAFATTTLVFFLAEMGDKTQVATVALAARYDALAAVVAGTTLGMMLANVPVVLLGERATKRVPLHVVRVIAALIFLVLGVAALVGL
jgi:putative Ca2+/H+ antiporter (TMEM165/GDT1 family)